jgi:hypothetical protein
MADLINLDLYRCSKLPLTPEEKQFDSFVEELRDVPLPMLIEALTAARDVRELVGIIDELAAVIIFCTTHEEKTNDQQ